MTTEIAAPYIWGILVVIGFAVVGFVIGWSKFKAAASDLFDTYLRSKDGKRTVNEIFSDYLRSDDSELFKMNADLKSKFDSLENLILAQASAQHDELTKFRAETFNKMLDANDRLIELLQNVLPKSLGINT